MTVENHVAYAVEIVAQGCSGRPLIVCHHMPQVMNLSRSQPITALQDIPLSLHTGKTPTRSPARCRIEPCCRDVGEYTLKFVQCQEALASCCLIDKLGTKNDPDINHPLLPDKGSVR